MKFTKEEHLKLLNANGSKILKGLKLKVADFPNTVWSAQEVAVRLGDDSLFEQCVNQYLQFLDEEVVDIKPCFSCCSREQYEEQIRLVPQSETLEHRQIGRTFQFSLKRIYDIRELTIELKEGVDCHLKGIKLHIGGLSDLETFKSVESLPYQQIFKPALRTQSFSIEFTLNESFQIQNCGCIRKSVDESRLICLHCNESFLFKSIQLVGTPVLQIDNITIDNESQIALLQNIIQDAALQSTQKLLKLQQLAHSLKITQDASIQQIRSDNAQFAQLYKEFNLASVIVEKYSQKIDEFYNYPPKIPQTVFTDCVECSRRVIRSAKVVDESLLRKLYFDVRIGEQERDTCIRLLEADQNCTRDDLEEFMLQTELNLSKNGEEFLHKHLKACIEEGLIEPTIHMLRFMILQIGERKSSNLIYELFSLAELECISKLDIYLVKLFECDDVHVQEYMSELIQGVSQYDSILGLNLLFSGLGIAKDCNYLQLFEKINIGQNGQAICEYLIYSCDLLRQDADTMIKCFQLIKRSWIQVTAPAHIYISLEQMHHTISGQQHLIPILTIYNQLYQTVANDPMLLEYLVQQMLESGNIQQIQRMTQMIHSLLFQRQEIQLKCVANRATEECVQKRQITYSSLDFQNFEQLKVRLKKDLALEMEFDLIIENKLLDDTSKSIDLIHKNFYVPEVTKIERRTLSFRDDESVSVKKKDNNIKYMIINFSIRGIGGHDDLPYVPQVQDEERLKQQNDFIKIIERYNLRAVFQLLRLMMEQQTKYLKTILRIVDILQFISISVQVRQDIINCQGLILFLKILLSDPSNTSLLEFIQSLLEQVPPNIRRRFSEQIDTCELQRHDKECLNNLQLIFNALETQEQLKKTLCQMIPLIVRDQQIPVEYLLTQFQQKIQFQNPSLRQMDIFAQILNANPKHYTQLRSKILECDIYDDALKYFLHQQQDIENPRLMAVALTIVFSTAKVNHTLQMTLMQLDVIQFAFDMAHNPAQEYSHLSNICHNFINFLKDEDESFVNPEIHTHVQMLFDNKNKHLKAITLQKKDLIKKKFQRAYNFSQIQDEKGLHCLSCKEGYTTNHQLLKIYIYCIAQQIPEEKSYQQGVIKEIVGCQSVTYFTIIHLQCHKKTVEYGIKQYNKDHEDAPKQNDEIEWECATKNNFAKCNNLFPIKNQNIEQGLEFYYRRCEKLFKSKMPSKQWLILNDLKGLILRMARLDDLAADTGAGKFEHNIKLIPFFVSSLLLFDMSMYYNLPANANIAQLTIVLTTCLFRPAQDWLSVKSAIISQVKEQQYLYNAIFLVSLIVDKFLTQVPKINFKENLDKFISDHKKTLDIFEEIEQEYSRRVPIQLTEL